MIHFSSHENNMPKIPHYNPFLNFEICGRGICEMIVYKHSETIEFVKN